ncbi:MAG: UbiA family prenyltransferase [Bacteroidota bacterium]|nr:UbiA family prenyltransferase [Bacteroidota bacterium]
MKQKISIIRPLNLIIVALTMLVVLLKYQNQQTENYWLQMIYLILPAVLTAAAGYIINDIKDIDIDKINKPGKNLIGTMVSQKEAYIFYAILNIVSLAVSFLLNEQYAMINVCIIGLLYLYAVQLKGVPLMGNIIIAICSSAVIACCILIIGFKTKIGFFNFSGYIGFAFLITLIRELVKTIEDMEGDKAYGIKTYPVVLGIKATKILIYFLSGFVIILCGIYSFIAWGVSMYASAIIMGVVTLAMFYFINFLSKSKEKTIYHQASNLLKGIIVLGLLNLIFS